MIKFWLVITAICFIFSACKAQNKSQIFDWKEFVSDDGTFKAIFPGVPTKTVKEFNGLNGKTPNIAYDVSFSEPEITFLIIYGEHANALTMDKNALKVNYDTIQNGLLKLMNAELISERGVWVNEKLGREVTLKRMNLTMKLRMYMIGSRQYQVISSTKSSLLKDAEIEKSVNKFLDSFQLIEK